MKKLFVIMLAVMMLLSCMVIAPAAEEETGRIIVTDGTVLSGWNGEIKSGIPEPVLNEELDDYPVVSFTYTGVIYNEGGWKNPELGDGKTPTKGVKIHYRTVGTETKEYDLTGMNYLIFDLYVSDPALVENVKFWLELTSVGAPDREERNWCQPLSAYVGGEVVAGWNHIELDLSTSRGDTGFNPSKWSFMRIFNSDGFDAGDGFTLAFKNMYFSASSPKAEQAQAAAQAVLDLFAPISEIGTGDITADNYETVKAQLAAALEAYIAADTATKAAVDATYDSNKIERSVIRAIEKYEESLEADDEPTTPPADEPTTPPADEPTTPPADEPTTPPTGEPSDDDATTGGDDATTGDDKAEPAKNDNLMLYLIVGGAVVLIAVVVIVIVVATKKKK